MHFSMKKYLKSNRYHTTKYFLRDIVMIQPNRFLSPIKIDNNFMILYEKVVTSLEFNNTQLLCSNF
jgi:hypothetical protein